MAPRPRSTIGGTYLAQRATMASQLVRTISASFSPSRSWKRPADPKPALLTSTSTSRPRDSISSNSDLRPSSLAMSAATISARTRCSRPSSSASDFSRSSRRATSVRFCPRFASSRAISVPMPEEAPVTMAVEFSLGDGNAIGRARVLRRLGFMSSEDPFGLFGDPDELRRRMQEFAEQMQGAQKVAWADNAIKLAVDMTVAGINRLNLQGNAEQQAAEVRSAMNQLFPEAVTLVREAREGFGT